MEVVSATIEDAREILCLQRLAYQTEATIYGDHRLPPLTETLDELQALFSRRRFLKAVAGGRIVGSVRGFECHGSCHIERLITHPDYRRRGIGTALLQQIESYFPAARRFELFTGHRSANNIRLYQRRGYRIFRSEKVDDRVTLVFMEKTFRVRDFGPGDERDFRRLNEAWISRYFAMEKKDHELFADPVAQIITPGGAILMVEKDGAAIGCCALIHRDAETFELGKMAVAEAYQGQGLGRVLLQHAVDRSRARGKRRLFLETNSRLQAAIHLYREFGFREVPIAGDHASDYARVDMAMELLL